MSISAQISRIQADKNTIRNKLVELGLATSADNLDVLASAIENIPNKGAVSAEVKEGETYTIPAGYHDGSGTVSGVAGGGNYSLQAKTATPTKKQQTIASDEGYYGISSVTIAPIPDAYQDVTAVTATEDQVLTGATYVKADGTIAAGTMTDNGAASGTLTPANAVHTIPKGYHNGLGTVGVANEEKTFTPTKEEQVHTATTKYVSKIVINPIPDAYQDVTAVTATADKVLIGSKFVDAEGNVVEGTMPRVEVQETLDVTKQSFDIPEGYHDGQGCVAITVEEKSATPTKSAQTITPTAGKVLSKVTVAAIPDQYQDITVTTAEAAHVLEDKFFVSANGVKTEGTMINNGAVALTLTGMTDETTSVVIPKGYHDGTGTVSLTSDIENALAAI